MINRNVLNCLFFNTKENCKKGISLIVLVITIVVIIILAAAVVMSLNNNNVLTNASSARYETDRDTMQSYLELAIQNITQKYHGTITLDVGRVYTLSTSNSKEEKGEITWISTDLGNMTGKIIFSEGEDTDTEFYTGHRLPIYGSKTNWYVNQDKKLVLKVGSRVYGADDIPGEYVNARNIFNSSKGAIYYGKYVNYTPENETTEKYKWRILYSDNVNLYLISDGYVNYNDLPKKDGVSLTKGNNDYCGFCNADILRKYNSLDDVPDDVKWLNSDFFSKINSFANYEKLKTQFNMRTVAYMLDKNIWSQKFGANSAKYVVGAPSIEMLLNSYNQGNYSTLYQAKAFEVVTGSSATIGYKISCDSGNTFTDSISDSSKYLKGSLYVITPRANAYWTCSLQTTTFESLYGVTNAGMIAPYTWYHTDFGFRPVVCLKQNIALKLKDDGTYDVVEIGI